MKRMTEEEIHIDLVESNLRICEEVRRRAEVANKGSRSHEINRTMCQFKPKLARLMKRSANEVTKEELYEVCRLRAHIADELYLVSQHL